MIRLAAVAIVNSQWPVAATDAHEVNRDQRIYSISIAESRATDHAMCSGEWASVEGCRKIFGDANLAAAFVIVTAREETNLARNVHEDRCRQFECDPRRWRSKGVLHVVPQARSLWQLHRPSSWTDEKWESIRGLSQEATDNAAWEAMKLFAGAYRLCGTIEGAITHFATGNTCHSYAWDKEAKRRAAVVVTVRNRLARLQAQPEQTEAAPVAMNSAGEEQ